MLESRQSRILGLAAIFSSISGGLVLPRLVPEAFQKTTDLGLVMSGSDARSLEDIWNSHNYNKAIYEKAQRECVNFDETATQRLATPDEMILTDVGLDRKVACESRSDRLQNIGMQILAFLLGPIMLILAFGVVKWTLAGTRQGDV